MASDTDTPKANAEARREGSAAPPRLGTPRLGGALEDATNTAQNARVAIGNVIGTQFQEARTSLLKGLDTASDALASHGPSLLERLRNLKRLRLRRTFAWFFQSLARRIVSFNMIALLVLMGGVLYLNQLRVGLTDMRIRSLEVQGAIIAVAIAEGATEDEEATLFDPYQANEILRQLVLPTGVRAQVYDRGGRLMGDTRSLISTQRRVDTSRLSKEGWGGVLGLIEAAYDGIIRLFFVETPPVYNETAIAGITRDAEVYTALGGTPDNAVRANSKGELIVSVAVPIQRIKGVLGVVVLSTEGGDIDRIIRAGRIEILRFFLVAAVVVILLSFLMARTIAYPISRLASAAEEGGARRDSKRVNPSRIRIPDFSRRSDEIGDLSGGLKRMTDALYRRIEAIESFAADVSHELKNPLTSLRSAVETFGIAKTDAQRQQLLEVIRHDVDRMDRLVTDIANASRLDAELVREEMGELDLTALIETLTNIAGPQAEKRGVELKLELPPVPLVIQGIESRLGQVVSNLIENAISFSSSGTSITITAIRQGNQRVMISVQDQGPGIPPENLDRIFDRFYTMRPDAEDFGQHSGLGLSISKQIVEAHGGELWARNVENPDDPGLFWGSEFVVVLPVRDK